MTKYERLYTADEVDGMIARAKAAAAQPEQEPTEYLYRVDVSRMKEGECTKYDHPIYFYSKADANNYCWTINQAPQQRTIVVAESHAIKIAAPPAAQQIDEAHSAGYSNGMTEGYEAGKAYAAAQRQWVGLTDDEQMALLKDSDGKTRHWLVWQVEAKLKEKNT